MSENHSKKATQCGESIANTFSQYSNVSICRTLLYLQIIIQIQTQLSGSDASSNILSKPEHILSFVKHALDAANAPAPEVDASSPGRHPRNSSGLRMEDLRLVPEDEVVSDEGDSDDDTPGEELISADDEMTETAINLLLSLLEGMASMWSFSLFQPDHYCSSS